MSGPVDAARSAEIFSLLRTDVPNEKQKEFFIARARHTAYGGARGGGKSWSGRRKLVMLGMKYAGLRMLLLRRTMVDLRENHLLVLQRELNGYAKYNREERAFTFPNGSRLKLGYCDNEGDVLQYQGQEYEVILFEEATQFPEDWVSDIRVTLRTPRRDFAPRCYYTCNPGGVGHAWVKRLFIDKIYKQGEKPEDYQFISAKVDDNPYVNPQYIEHLDNLPEMRRRAWRDGEWNLYEGQVFESFRDDPEHYGDRIYTHIIEPFEIPKSWTIYRSFDFGYAKPFSVGWWAVDYDGTLYRIAEWYGCVKNMANTGIKITPEEIFEGILEREGSEPNLAGRKIRGVADPSIWDASRGVSIAEVGEKYRIYFDEGDNKRLPGLMQVQQRLKFDDEGKPLMYAFQTCRDFIRTLPLLQYDTKKTEDIDTDGEDHVYDEVRYMCMARPVKAKDEVADKSRWSRSQREDYNNASSAAERAALAKEFNSIAKQAEEQGFTRRR